MIQTSSIANLHHMQQNKIWLIVRSIGKAASLLSRPDVRWVPDLSPSKNLFFAYLRWKKEGIWGPACFEERYKPQFLQEADNPAFQQAFRELLAADAAGKTITLACFCPDERLCHRSIVKEKIEQAKGAPL